jgi:hypothetical protein
MVTPESWTKDGLTLMVSKKQTKSQSGDSKSKALFDLIETDFGLVIMGAAVVMLTMSCPKIPMECGNKHRD